MTDKVTITYDGDDIEVPSGLVPLVKELHRAGIVVDEVYYVKEYVHLELYDYEDKMTFVTVSGQTEEMKDKICGGKEFMWQTYAEMNYKKDEEDGSYIYYEVFNMEFQRIDVEHIVNSFIKYNDANEAKAKEKEKQKEKIKNTTPESSPPSSQQSSPDISPMAPDANFFNDLPDLEPSSPQATLHELFQPLGMELPKPDAVDTDIEKSKQSLAIDLTKLDQPKKKKRYTVV